MLFLDISGFNMSKKQVQHHLHLQGHKIKSTMKISIISET